MDESANKVDFNFEVGDIVEESEYIIPPDRKPWTGIVVFIEENFFKVSSLLGPQENLIAVHWFQAGYIEALPASVLIMIQKAKEK